MSETNKGVIWAAGFPRTGSLKVIPLSPPKLKLIPTCRDFLFYQSTGESLLLRGAEGKINKPEG